MTEFFLSHIESVVALAPVWGFAFIFFFMAVESSCIPFPSEIVMIPAGFLAARSELSFGVPGLDLLVAVLAGLAGSMVGAYFNYFLALKLGTPFLRKYGKYLFIKAEALDRASEIFNRYGDMTTFVCRLIPVVRQLISLPAGLAAMPLGRFSFFTALGAGIWTTILAVVGWGMGRSSADLTYRDLITQGKAMVDHNLIWLLLGLAVLVGLYVLASKLVMNRKLPPSAPSSGKK